MLTRLNFGESERFKKCLSGLSNLRSFDKVYPGLAVLAFIFVYNLVDNIHAVNPNADSQGWRLKLVEVAEEETNSELAGGTLRMNL
jgi:hypothetical protein